MSSIILFDRTSQLDRVDSWREAENGDFLKKKRGGRGTKAACLPLFSAEFTVEREKEKNPICFFLCHITGVCCAAESLVFY